MACSFTDQCRGARSGLGIVHEFVGRSHLQLFAEHELGRDRVRGEFKEGRPCANTARVQDERQRCWPRRVTRHSVPWSVWPGATLHRAARFTDVLLADLARTSQRCAGFRRLVGNTVRRALRIAAYTGVATRRGCRYESLGGSVRDGGCRYGSLVGKGVYWEGGPAGTCRPPRCSRRLSSRRPARSSATGAARRGLQDGPGRTESRRGAVHSLRKARRYALTRMVGKRADRAP